MGVRGSGWKKNRNRDYRQEFFTNATKNTLKGAWAPRTSYEIAEGCLQQPRNGASNRGDNADVSLTEGADGSSRPEWAEIGQTVLPRLLSY